MEHYLSELILHYGYLGLIVVLAAGIVGIPVPDEVVLTFVGYNVSRGNMTYITALLSGMLGALLGITVSYILGLRLGLPVLKKYGSRLGITEEKIQRTHELFEKYGPFLLMIGYFLPGVRHLTAYFAGLSDLSLRKFCLYAYTGAFIWVGLFVTLGVKLGENWRYMQYYVHHYGSYVVALSGFVGIVWFIYFFFFKKVKQNRV
ncbi:MAG: DedA family protein [Ectobacillus sp.]